MQKKAAASTIIEVLVAMVVIMVVFAIAMQLFKQVMGSGVSIRKIRVQQELAALAEETQQSGFVLHEKYMKDSVNYLYQSDTTGLRGYAKLQIKAMDGAHVLGTISCYYQIKDEHAED